MYLMGRKSKLMWFTIVTCVHKTQNIKKTFKSIVMHIQHSQGLTPSKEHLSAKSWSIPSSCTTSTTAPGDVASTVSSSIAYTRNFAVSVTPPHQAPSCPHLLQLPAWLHTLEVVGFVVSFLSHPRHPPMNDPSKCMHSGQKQLVSCT